MFCTKIIKQIKPENCEGCKYNGYRTIKDCQNRNLMIYHDLSANKLKDRFSRET